MCELDQQIVNEPKVTRWPRFFIAGGGLHRGVPRSVVGEDGLEITVLIENNTGKVFPLDEAPLEKEGTPPET